MKPPAGVPVEGRPPDVLRHLGTALPRQWRRYRKRLQRCQRKFSAAAVHDSRIETRRLLATFELLAAFISADELRKPRRALKQHLDAFDDLRDTQVQLATVAPMRRGSPAARTFHAWLGQRETRCIRAARQAVRQIKTRRLGKRIAALDVELCRQRKSTTPDQAFRIAQTAIRLAFAQVGRLCRRVKTADTRTIHRTRIAFKRFRYMVEALAPLLPAVTDQAREAMRVYQAMMGDIQDSKVMLAALDQFMESEDAAATQRLRDEFVRRREQLVQGYIAVAQQLWLFWPPGKLAPRASHDKRKQP